MGTLISHQLPLARKPRKNSMRLPFISQILALSVILTAGCTFRVPTVAEQEKLMEMGAFPTGAPGWISPAARGEVAGATLSSGIVPLSFSAQPGQTSAVAFSTGSVSSRAFETPPQPTLPGRTEESARKATAELSPLERISQDCPNIESAVTSALTTTESDIRIKKYETLTRRCPSSSDLLLWLAKDYLKIGNYSKATQSVESVLRMDNQHREARELLSDIRKAQLARQAPVAQPPTSN